MTQLLCREKLEQRGIAMETLQYTFPLHFVPPLPAPPALAQGPPPPHASDAPSYPTA